MRLVWWELPGRAAGEGSGFNEDQLPAEKSVFVASPRGLLSGVSPPQSQRAWDVLSPSWVYLACKIRRHAEQFSAQWETSN